MKKRQLGCGLDLEVIQTQEQRFVHKRRFDVWIFNFDILYSAQKSEYTLECFRDL